MNNSNKIVLRASAYLLSCLFIVSTVFNIGHQYQHLNHNHKRCSIGGAEKHFHNEDYAVEHCNYCFLQYSPKEFNSSLLKIGLKPIEKNISSFNVLECAASSTYSVNPKRGPPSQT